jgi:hypothetical protein
MKRRLANRVLAHEERAHKVCVPEWLMRWAFDYCMEHGKPAVLDVRLKSNSPFVEVNPQPQTWASGSTRVYRTS